MGRIKKPCQVKQRLVRVLPYMDEETHLPHGQAAKTVCLGIESIPAGRRGGCENLFAEAGPCVQNCNSNSSHLGGLKHLKW